MESEIARKIFLLVKTLPERSAEILLFRFGLINGRPSTLNQIGRKYSITRERVRQIQNSALRTLRKKEGKALAKHFSVLKKIFEEYGPVISEKHLLLMAKKKLALTRKEEIPFIIFLLNLGPKFFESKRTINFNKFWYLEKNDKIKFKKIINQFLKTLQTHREPLSKGTLYRMIKNTVKQETQKDLTHKELKALLNLCRRLKKNSLGLWGLETWPEITPKNSGDYAYLAILSAKKPLHFNDIPKEIIQRNIEKKSFHAPTVHNVLIKDPRFVLIGKGKYALAQWGYIPGTVTDLLEKILVQNEKTMGRKALIEEILKQREVRKSTIMLNIKRNPRIKEEGEKIILIK